MVYLQRKNFIFERIEKLVEVLCWRAFRILYLKIFKALCMHYECHHVQGLRNVFIRKALNVRVQRSKYFDMQDFCRPLNILR